MTNKASIAKNISKELNLSLNDSKKILEKFLNIVTNNANSKDIKINGFGVFGYKISPKRVGRNPKTLESYIIQPLNKLIFRSSNKIKKLLN